jgi:hypothetical protein
MGENAAITLPTVQFPAFSTGNFEAAIAVLITLLFIWWVIYTVVAGYHWFRYARDSWVAVPAMAFHLIASAWIFIFAIGGFH